MSWFEKHLNWSLFFAISLLPFIIELILGAILFAFMGPSIIAAIGSSEPTSEAISTLLPLVLVGLALTLAYVIWTIIAVLWYLRKKARSKWFLMLLFGPVIIGVMIALFGMREVGEVIGNLCVLVGIGWLYLLRNHSGGQGADFGYQPASDRWPDSGPTDGYEDRQTAGPDYTKELDYTPSRNVMDIASSQPAKDIKYTSDVPVGGSQEVQQAAREAPALEKAHDGAAGHEKPQMPILLDDSGAVISCSYHPGADAVNLCSRCRKYVCIECNYITGTHPICRNCWERRAEVPLAPPQKASQGPRKPEKKKVVEPPPPKPEQPPAAEPEEPKVAEVSQPAATEPVAAQQPVAQPTLVESMKPAEQVVQQPAAPEPQPVPQLAAPVQPEYVAPAEPEKQKAVKPEKQKAVKPEKAAKEEAEKKEWQSEFMSLYQQAAPIINVVVSKSADGMPGSPLDLMEGLKLRPMLERVKKLSKPKDKEMREAKSHLEQLLSSCIKIADAAANFVSGGGQALLGGPDFKRITEGIETANGFMEKLSQKMATFSSPQE